MSLVKGRTLAVECEIVAASSGHYSSKLLPLPNKSVLETRVRTEARLFDPGTVGLWLRRVRGNSELMRCQFVFAFRRVRSNVSTVAIADDG